MTDFKKASTLSKELAEILSQIADKTLIFTNNNDISLINGVSGQLLFYSYLEKYKSSKENQKSIKQLTKILFEKANSNNSVGVTFCYGLTGVGWLITNLINNKLIDEDDYDEEYFQELDRILLNRLYTSNTKFVYDFFDGYLGYGMYALERLNRNSEDANVILETIVTLLDSQKVVEDNRYSWPFIDYENLIPSPEDNTFYDDNVLYNVGLAHGIPSILMVLCNIYANNIKKGKCVELIKGGVNWLKNTSEEYIKNFKEEDFCSYPNVIYKDKTMSSSRLSWCYGDLSISLTLGSIALKLNDINMYEYSEKLAIKSAEDALGFYLLTDEPGFCHGSAGNAYMFSKLYKIFKKEILLDASIKFYEHLRDLQLESNIGIAGFKSKDYDPITKKQFFKDNPGFLTGTSGIGLAILGLLTENNEWDSALLLR